MSRDSTAAQLEVVNPEVDAGMSDSKGHLPALWHIHSQWVLLSPAIAGAFGVIQNSPSPVFTELWLMGHKTVNDQGTVGNGSTYCSCCSLQGAGVRDGSSHKGDFLHRVLWWAVGWSLPQRQSPQAVLSSSVILFCEPKGWLCARHRHSCDFFKYRISRVWG